MTIENILAMMGGIGLFLYGMKIMGDGLELAAGTRLRRLLEILTTNKFLGAFVGFIITAVIQSSAATTVMTIGFVNAGLMSLGQAVGVIMGANIGTTVTGLIVALDLGKIAPIFVFVGAFLILFFKKKSFNHVGMIAAGFGILFIGMSTMKTAMGGLQDMPWFNAVFEYTRNPFIGVVFGMVVTALIQSSSATTGILISMAGAGLIGLDQAVFILYGQNIGTCVTAMLASIGTTRTARRAALIHLLFNLIGTMLFVAITVFTPFTQWIQQLIPLPEFQFSATHIIFNVVTTAILLPCSSVLVFIAQKLIPGEDEGEKMTLQFIDERILNTPAIAVRQVVKEVERMARIAQKNIRAAVSSLYERSEDTIEKVFSREKVINFLNHEITTYLIKLNALELSDEDYKIVGSLFHVVSDIERIGDHAENIAETAQSLIRSELTMSEAAMADLQNMTGNVEKLLDEVISYFTEHSYNRQEEDYIYKIETNIDNMTDDYKQRHIERLNCHACTPAIGMLFVDLLTNLERVADHGTNIAKAVADSKSKI